MRSGVFRSRTLQSVTIRCKRLRIIPITRGLRQAQPGIFFPQPFFLLFHYFLLKKNKHAHRREFILAEKLKKGRNQHLLLLFARLLFLWVWPI